MSRGRVGTGPSRRVEQGNGNTSRSRALRDRPPGVPVLELVIGIIAVLGTAAAVRLAAPALANRGERQPARHGRR